MTEDVAKGESFYRNVLGWNISDSGMSDHTYKILSVEKNAIGGLMTIPEEICGTDRHSCWRGYIGVENVDAYAERAKAAGATIRRAPQDIPGVGRFAVIVDPQGAPFILFSGMNGMEAPPRPPAGTAGYVGWHELLTTDLDAAWAFYAQLFGWTKGEAVDLGPMGIYQIFEIDGVGSGGMMKLPSAECPPSWVYYFNVDDIDATLERVRQNGGTVDNGPCQVPGGSWIAQCTDSQGAAFAVVACKRAS